MQSFIEVTLPLIFVLIFGILILGWSVIMGLSKMREWDARRKESEARAGKYISREIDFMKAAHANMDAVVMMISEISAHRAMYETMSPEVSDSLYKAFEMARNLPLYPSERSR